MRLAIEGPAGGDWTLRREAGNWHLLAGTASGARRHGHDVRRHRLAALLEGARPGGRARPRPDRRRSGARRGRARRARRDGLRPRPAAERHESGDRDRACRRLRPEGPPPPPAARPSRTRSAAAPAQRAPAVPREAQLIRSTSSTAAPAASSSAAPASPRPSGASSPTHAMPTATRGSRPLSAACQTPATTSGITSGRQCSRPDGHRRDGHARHQECAHGRDQRPGQVAVQRPEAGDGPGRDQQTEPPAAAPPPGSTGTDASPLTPQPYRTRDRGHEPPGRQEREREPRARAGVVARPPPAASRWPAQAATMTPEHDEAQVRSDRGRERPGQQARRTAARGCSSVAIGRRSEPEVPADHATARHRGRPPPAPRGRARRTAPRRPDQPRPSPAASRQAQARWPRRSSGPSGGRAPRPAPSRWPGRRRAPRAPRRPRGSRRAARPAPRRAGSASGDAGPASPATASPEAVAARPAARRARDRGRRAAPSRMSRNPRWIIFCIAECVEHGSVGL